MWKRCAKALFSSDKIYPPLCDDTVHRTLSVRAWQTKTLKIASCHPSLLSVFPNPALGLRQIWEFLDPPGLLDDDVTGALLPGNHPSDNEQRLPQHQPEPLVDLGPHHQRDVSELVLQSDDTARPSGRWRRITSPAFEDAAVPGPALPAGAAAIGYSWAGNAALFPITRLSAPLIMLPQTCQSPKQVDLASQSRILRIPAGMIRGISESHTF
jgi:hypothetical protein